MTAPAVRVGYRRTARATQGILWAVSRGRYREAARHGDQLGDVDVLLMPERPRIAGGEDVDRLAMPIGAAGTDTDDDVERCSVRQGAPHVRLRRIRPPEEIGVIPPNITDAGGGHARRAGFGRRRRVPRSTATPSQEERESGNTGKRAMGHACMVARGDGEGCTAVSGCCAREGA